MNDHDHDPEDWILHNANLAAKKASEPHEHREHPEFSGHEHAEIGGEG